MDAQGVAHWVNLTDTLLGVDPIFRYIGSNFAFASRDERTIAVGQEMQEKQQRAVRYAWQAWPKRPAASSIVNVSNQETDDVA